HTHDSSSRPGCDNDPAASCRGTSPELAVQTARLTPVSKVRLKSHHATYYRHPLWTLRSPRPWLARYMGPTRAQRPYRLMVRPTGPRQADIAVFYRAETLPDHP